ncbi:MAG: class I SAM-dependent methyltransferase [Parachlamydiales bacterium]|jgi:2-polyprenyl-3-methyl-5-hydroxy-6-metoxy-1,4-benzoquinol methylase
MKIDIGKYNKDPKEYENLMQDLYNKYPDGINLPSEYAFFVQENLMSLLIRLARYKFVSRLLKKTDKVLEVGCGSGLGSIFLSQHCLHVTAIDNKLTEIQEALAINQRKNIKFEKNDLFNMDPQNDYDFVVALDVIEHLTEEQGIQLIKTMSKFLKKEGMLVLGTPSIYSYPYQGKLSRASHIKCYDQEELSKVIDKFFNRTLAFSMNDEMVHTGNSKMAWYYFVIGLMPK